MTYSYNPANIGEDGLDKMRFELGDCLVEEADKTAYVSDEEITAVLESSKSWRHAKLRLLESLLHRFAYEVNTEIHEAKWDLSDRFKNWENLYKRLKAELEVEELSGSFGFASRHQRPPIFRVGQFDWGR